MAGLLSAADAHELPPRAGREGLERPVAALADLHAVEDELGALVLLRQPARDPARALARGAVAQDDDRVRLAALQADPPVPVQREPGAHALEQARLALRRPGFQPALHGL